MSKLNIASTEKARCYFATERNIVDAHDTDFVDVSALILSDEDEDYQQLLSQVRATKLNIPVFLATNDSDKIGADVLSQIYQVIDTNAKFDRKLVDRAIDHAASQYEDKVLPPFFGALKSYVERGNLQFDCPGHQGGAYFRKHPAGREFYKFYGENLFRSDICNADVDLGDLLIHEGPALDAERHAAKVYNADRTYFVMNGSSTSNNIVGSAAVAPGDLVLFDRNNHKSIYNQALVMSGGKPVYLQDSRDPYGFIGGIYNDDFDEEFLRKQAAKVDPEKAKQKRPFRLAVVQLGTYDGTIANAHQIIKKIGGLCDYILFDSAWVGYEQFIPFMNECSPLTMELGPDDPGIFVVQSIHKQQAGFSQTSQIHKKDSHIKGQKRYITDDQFNNAYLKYSSTSPFYPLFAALDVNAKIQGSEAGRKLWHDSMVVSVNARKKLLKHAKYIRPFVPAEVDGKKWENIDTEDIVSHRKYWEYDPEKEWHGFEGYGKNQYFVDPNKFLLTTSGINIKNGEYTDFGIPAVILANYLREHGIIPEKNDLNSILFLMTPAESDSKMDSLVSQILNFERLVDEDAPLSQVLPRLYSQNEERYKGYTIRQLCQELHDFYREKNTKEYQKKLFLRKYFPEQTMTPMQADIEMLHNNVKIINLKEAVGHTAVEGALPYPPGIFCVVPGEKWSKIAQKYFDILLEGINKFPGFAPEIQGVYFKEKNGVTSAYCQVLDDATESKYAK